MLESVMRKNLVGSSGLAIRQYFRKSVDVYIVAEKLDHFRTDDLDILEQHIAA